MVLKAKLDFWTSENRDVILIEHGLVGYTWLDDHTIDVGPVFVHPRHRRQGIGVHLIDELKEVEGVEMIQAIVRPARKDALGMMLKAGFHETGRDGSEILLIWRKDD